MEKSVEQAESSLLDILPKDSRVNAALMIYGGLLETTGFVADSVEALIGGMVIALVSAVGLYRNAD